MLSGHQRVELRRRFHTAALEEMGGRVALRFPDGSLAFAYLVVGQWCVSVSIEQAAPLSVMDAVLGARDELRRILC